MIDGEYEDNPIDWGTGIVLGAAIIGAVLLFKKPSKATVVSSGKAPEGSARAPVTASPAPTLAPQPNTTVHTPTPPSGSWIAWDGCFVQGKNYRMCSKLSSAPKSTDLMDAVTALEKIGFKVSASQYDSGENVVCIVAVWTAATECGSKVLDGFDIRVQV